MKNLIILLPCILIVNSANSQYEQTVTGVHNVGNTDSIHTYGRRDLNRNLFCVDIDIISTTFSYSRKLNDKNFIGGGLGFGFSYTYRISKVSYPIKKFAKIKMHLMYFPYQWLNLELGLQRSVVFWGGEGENEGLFDDPFGVYVSPAIGWRKIKFGTEILMELGFVNNQSFTLQMTPIMLKILLPF